MIAAGGVAVGAGVVLAVDYILRATKTMRVVLNAYGEGVRRGAEDGRKRGFEDGVEFARRDNGEPS